MLENKNFCRVIDTQYGQYVLIAYPHTAAIFSMVVWNGVGYTRTITYDTRAERDEDFLSYSVEEATKDYFEYIINALEEWYAANVKIKLEGITEETVCVVRGPGIDVEAPYDIAKKDLFEQIAIGNLPVTLHVGQFLNNGWDTGELIISSDSLV